MDHNNFRSVLRNTKQNCLGSFRTKGVECWHPLQFSSRTIRFRVQLLALEHCWSISTGGCWPPSLQPWSRSERLLPVYLPVELFVISALQQQWGVDGRRQNMAKLTGSRLLWHRYKINLFPDTTTASIPVVSTLRSSLSVYVFFVYNKFYFPLFSLLTAHRKLLSE
jgi:hypothetical protein